MKGITGSPELGSVTVGVDGSEPARRAALWAAAEAARRGSTLRIVHATDTDSRVLYLSVENIERVRRAGHELLRETAAAITELHSDLHVTTEFSGGAAVPSLRRTTGPRGTVVVGNRGLGGFKNLMLGSVGLKVAAEATTPVVIVRGTDEGTERGVVLAAVRDEHDAECARYAACEAEIHKASLRLLHVWSILGSAGLAVTMLDDVEEIVGEHVHHLNAVTDRIRDEFPDLNVQADAEKSLNAAGVLVEASRHADLLVMGGRRRPGYIGPTLGRATHSLLHHAHCPVQLIPRHGSGQGSDS
ncbi:MULTISPECIES: universal stress protein [unclassified Streptomyces]|uniref:universal stress protein n=1 Tax=unclassified Streptomyces TaxID=2593676 RepID=UPI002E78EBE4|nr:universal stress protein [Streptomyces sp. JV184]MEE1744733.1 universal stress protein [Streptomyces sp. JV184]